jgi:hypothetical protein
MKYLALIVLATVPLLIFGMAFHGVRVYFSGDLRTVDVIGFILQVFIILVCLVVGVVVWKHHGGEKDR